MPSEDDCSWKQWAKTYQDEACPPPAHNKINMQPMEKVLEKVSKITHTTDIFFVISLNTLDPNYQAVNGHIQPVLTPRMLH